MGIVLFSCLEIFVITKQFEARLMCLVYKQKTTIIIQNHMKKILPVALALGAALITGCAGVNQNSVAGNKVSSPFVTGQLNAHLEPSKRVTASGNVETYQVLGFKWNAGGQEKYVGNVGGRPVLANEFGAFTPFQSLIQSLIGSPADKQAAVNEAYYNAIEAVNTDALLNTKVKVHTEGFSILGIYGHGTSTATVDGFGANVVKGSLPYGTVLH